MIKPKMLPSDVNQRAQQIAKLLTGEEEEPKAAERSEVSAYLSEIGRKGGLKGGKERVAKLSQSRRKAIAKKAAQSCWKG